jgi:hypothetical protein
MRTFALGSEREGKKKGEERKEERRRKERRKRRRKERRKERKERRRERKERRKSVFSTHTAELLDKALRALQLLSGEKRLHVGEVAIKSLVELRQRKLRNFVLIAPHDTAASGSTAKRHLNRGTCAKQRDRASKRAEH